MGPKGLKVTSFLPIEIYLRPERPPQLAVVHVNVFYTCTISNYTLLHANEHRQRQILMSSQKVKMSCCGVLGTFPC